MNSILIQEHYTVENCLNNPRHLYIFGDNLIKQGKGGQAIIRDCPNAFGIPIKRYSNNKETSFLVINLMKYMLLKQLLII